MAQATVTPLVLGETLHPPKYGKEWNDVPSRKFLGAYLDYEERLQIAYQEGGVRHTQVPVGQLILAYIRQCFELIYTDGRPMPQNSSTLWSSMRGLPLPVVEMIKLVLRRTSNAC